MQKTYKWEEPAFSLQLISHSEEKWKMDEGDISYSNVKWVKFGTEGNNKYYLREVSLEIWMKMSTLCLKTERKLKHY